MSLQKEAQAELDKVEAEWAKANADLTNARTEVRKVWERMVKAKAKLATRPQAR